MLSFTSHRYRFRSEDSENMTIVTGSKQPASSPAQQGPQGGSSIAVSRSRKLLAAGLLAAHGAALVAVGISWLFGGALAAISAAFGAALVIFFYTVGMAIQVRFADADARVLLGVSLASFVTRAALLVGLLAIYFRFVVASDRLRPVPFAAAALLCVVAWLAGELQAYARLRIPHFDEPVSGSGEEAASG